MTQVFIIAFVVSYLGSIPPGTINVTTMQMAIQKKGRAAFFLSLGASIVEFVYAGLTVKFQLFLSSSPWIMEHFYLLSASAMVILGVANLLATTNSRSVIVKMETTGRNGFVKGIILGVLNPLTIPFWLAVTAYMQTHGWISLEGSLFWIYLTGISLGTFALLLSILSFGGNFSKIIDNLFLVHKLPGIIFLGLGLYNFILWWTG